MNGKLFHLIIIVFFLSAVLMYDNGEGAKASVKEIYFYTGTYTDNGGEGIYLSKLDLSSGKVELINITKSIVNPSYLALDSEKKFLYAVNEISDFENQNAGSVTALKIDYAENKLIKINRKSTSGAHPCYISIDAQNKFALVANYTGGNISAIKINDDGSLGEIISVIQHEGSSINPQRQSSPHAHCIELDNNSKFVFAADLGIDKIMIYKFNAEQGIIHNENKFSTLPGGAGPRHITFHPNNNFAYVINELNNTVTSYRFYSLTGKLELINNYNTLPEDFAGISFCADIHIHPSGKYLYASNRGHNSIAIFSIDEDTGLLELRGYESTKGNWPRNFAIDPTGNFLVAANQKSDNLTVFRIDAETGMLSYTGFELRIPSPVCIKFRN